MNTSTLNNAIRISLATLLIALTTSALHGSVVSTPYLNTFDTASSTNDFSHGGSPASKLEFVEWAWHSSSATHRNYMRSSNAIANLFGWATLGFEDLGGTPTQARNFNMAATMRARNNQTTVLNRPGGYQGLIALASNEALGEYYYGMVFFTNVVGYVKISKIVAGSEILSATAPTTITFDRVRHYGLRLTGNYSPSSSPDLTLAFHLSYGSETNSLSLVDPSPLTGSRFGYRSYNNHGGCWIWWDNLSVESSAVQFPGTVLLIR